MSFAAVLAAMPDLLARALAEHVPDDHGRCRECRADDGTSAPWPCAMRLLADEARGMTGAQQRRPEPPAAPMRPRQPLPQRPAAPRPGYGDDQNPETRHLETQHLETQHPETRPAPVVGGPVYEGPVTAPQPPVSDTWDPLADRRAFRRERYQNHR
ncbi:hypothetical protein ACQEVB_26105 [Pseudonocardia sp. CA-107938]|uniref:hypothetical protein n=1 Tax=Pseudonocardia sp. CA-107938 TaxID=3240021 RepID=UPI003D8E0369